MPNSPATYDKHISELSERIMALKNERASLMRARPREIVSDFVFTRLDGSRCTLSELMGESDELLVVHNMGKKCRYCAIWADGFVGIARHLATRAPFVLCANDPPEVARETAARRGWTFQVVCNTKQPDGRGFSQSLGYGTDDDVHPGISAFRRVRRDDGGTELTHTAHAPFGPGDDFCAVWPVLELLGIGVDDWSPRE
ncbi:MAG: DUF899 family protein [Planctomycetota bacterium]|nr:DUF899 family protein [Planctomycetota bacterium]MDA1105903.1 DUF899 family protein [Planctomycetota bacterium]